MFEPIYEIRISGKNIEIKKEKWDEIREHARNYALFYIIYKGKTYKYVHNQTYMNRPTRFDFEPVPSDEEGVIEYIRVD